MKNSIRFIFLPLVAALVWVSCDKEDSGKPAAEKLAAQTCWQLKKFEVKAVFWIDGIQDCQKDDCYNFATGGSLTVERDTTLCAAIEPQSSTGTWELIDSDKKIVLGIDSQVDTFEIQDILDKKLVLYTKDFLGQDGEFRFTYEPK